MPLPSEMPTHTAGPPYTRPTHPDSALHGLQGCYEAFRRQLNATHIISCLPGSQAVSGKAELAASLESAYGAAAWGILPLSFRLPQQYAALATHLKQARLDAVCCRFVHNGIGMSIMPALLGSLPSGTHTQPPPPFTRAALQEQSRGRHSLWLMKEEVHRGAGVRVVNPAQALAWGLAPDRGSGASGGSDGDTRSVLAQRFVADQLLVEGRPVYIRWGGCN